jgi:putative exporter of polyketide antibiotics
VYGLPTAINTLGGFAVWRVEIFVTLLGTVWMVLATTRVLRGNEETGRLDLVLANPLSLTRATAVSLATIFAVPLLTALVAGRSCRGSAPRRRGPGCMPWGSGCCSPRSRRPRRSHRS